RLLKRLAVVRWPAAKTETLTAAQRPPADALGRDIDCPPPGLAVVALERARAPGIGAVTSGAVPAGTIDGELLPRFVATGSHALEDWSMDAQEFRRHGYALIDWLADYHATLVRCSRRPGPATCAPSFPSRRRTRRSPSRRSSPTSIGWSRHI